MIGDFNHWNAAADIMRPSPAGVWEGFVPDIGSGAVYKYHMVSRDRPYTVDKADPYGFRRRNSAAYGFARLGLARLFLAGSILDGEPGEK